jgi:hypothetical protein
MDAHSVSNLCVCLGGGGVTMFQEDRTHCRFSYFQTHLVRRNSDIMELYSNPVKSQTAQLYHTTHYNSLVDK